MPQPLILAIDQGTSSTRAMVFDANSTVVTSAQSEFTQFYPADGWVEHDPEEIWSTTLAVCGEALSAIPNGRRVEVAGITNQRETTVVWERATGKPIYNAIVWQDRRTADMCDGLKARNLEPRFTERTGLLLDPYFSGTKLAWILDHVAGARDAANRGELAFGTTDTFLLWRLTGGRVYATDATNASRTLLFNIHTQQWDEELLEALSIPRSMLPEVLDSSADFGTINPETFGYPIPIGGVAGDQQAAAFGQACFTPGMLKSTYGTGCFALLNTGTTAVESSNRLLTTIAYRLGGETHYAIEGSIFVAGAAVQWLRDGLSVIQSAAEVEGIASAMHGNHGVYLVPAFTGLGAPHWDARARGAVFGLTRDTGIAELVRAALESVVYQSADLIDAMQADLKMKGAGALTGLRVDGGMAVNNWLMQFLADISGVDVDRPVVTETTALGAAYLAGLQAGIYDSLDDIDAQWRRDRRFEAAMDDSSRAQLLSEWRNAVERVKQP